MLKKPLLGISACLLGKPLRYDGGHRRDAYLAARLARHVRWLPLCPEMECGLGVPRPPMRLVGDPRSPEVVVTETGEDMTAGLKRSSLTIIKKLIPERPCGFVLKARSPSCAPGKAEVLASNRRILKSGTGLFTLELRKRHPHVPIVSEEDLADEETRRSFLLRACVYQRWLDFTSSQPTLKGLALFHAGMRLTAMAHSPEACARLDRLAAEHSNKSTVLGSYISLLMDGLRLASTPRKNYRALRHAAEALAGDLSYAEHRRVCEALRGYPKGQHELRECTTLINRYAVRYGNSYLGAQLYLNPTPLERRLLKAF